MKFIKVTIFVAVLGLASSLLPKTGSAADVSVGFSFGMPVSAVAVYPAVPHAPPVAAAPVFAPAAFYPAAYYHHPYHRHAYGYRTHFRHHQGHGYRGRGCRNGWNRH